MGPSAEKRWNSSRPLKCPNSERHWMGRPEIGCFPLFPQALRHRPILSARNGWIFRRRNMIDRLCCIVFYTIAGLLMVTSDAAAQMKPRARDLGIPFEGAPGAANAISDVKGIEVGHVTLISGEGKLQVGVGPVRTGVTAIFPRGKSAVDPVFAGWFTENGNGEMTGTTWVEESGFLYGPVMITNTHSVGVVRDTVIDWQLKDGTPIPLEDWWSLPVVAETWDGEL